MSEQKIPKALIVEDQELFRQAVADELKFLGFQTAVAKDGSEGLTMALATPYDLVLSDIRMPNKDGRWFLNELRKTRKVAPPFIFMTGFADLSVYEAFEMGADGFLGKPVDSDKLAQLLAKACRPLESRWSEAPREPAAYHINKTFSHWGSPATLSEIALGRGGFFIAMDVSNLKVGDLVSFDLQFKDGPLSRLEGSGCVAWKRDMAEDNLAIGCGITLDYVAPSSLANWLAYIGVKEIVPVIPKGRVVARDDAAVGV